MKDSDLKNDLRLLVDRYGIDRVHREMQTIASSEKRMTVKSRKPLRESGTQGKVKRKSSKVTAVEYVRITVKSGKPIRKSETQSKVKRRSSKATAVEYVSRMDVAAERRVPMLALAKRFGERSFLPTYADIQDFCRIYGIEEPASKTRANVIPRVFKFLAAMEVHDLQRLLDENAFSGPARLGPIADAIRRHGRTARGRQFPL